MQAIVTVTDNVGKEEHETQKRINYFTEITKPLINNFQELIQRSEFTKISSNPQVIFTGNASPFNLIRG